MRNPYKARRLRSAQTVARLYLELIRTTVADPPVLSREQNAKMRAELALPRDAGVVQRRLAGV